MKAKRFLMASAIVTMVPALAWATMDPAEEMARKLANPLASIHALITENNVNYGSNNAPDNYNFQLQPVWAVDAPKLNASFIPRAVIPINGRRLSADGGFDWGAGDAIFQLYYAPYMESGWKWGIGPQFSFKTRSQEGMGSLGNGAGAALISVGNISEQLAFAGIAFNHWSYDGNVSIATIQPMFFYNVPGRPGMVVMYNHPSTINWKADGDKVTIPLGLGVGQSFALDGGFGLDFNIGAYGYPVRAVNTPEWTLKFGISLILP